MIVDSTGIKVTTSRLRQHGQLPALSLHTTEIVLKTQSQGCTGQLTTRPVCTGVHFNALSLAIYIFVGLNLTLWYRETHINPRKNRAKSTISESERAN